MLPEMDEFGKYFHELFRITPENLRKHQEWKKIKKRPKLKSKNKQDSLFQVTQASPILELPYNASAFAVFATVRLAILERWMQQASLMVPQTNNRAIMPQEHSEIESDTEDNTQSSTDVPIKVSQMVGLGLRSVFELIKESRTTHPTLCSKALLALLDVLQGQTPEGLKGEPIDIIDPLFELLLDLATSHGPETSVPNDGSHLTAIACACLLSLVVVRGDTGKFLAAAAALLMCPRALAFQNIKMPPVLTSLQKSIYSVVLGKDQRPTWINNGVPHTSKLESFTVRMPSELQNTVLSVKSLAADGQYLYLFTFRGLFKIGSGYGGTVKGHVYIWKPDFYPNDRGTLVYCSGNLYLKLCGKRGSEFLIVERQNLLICGSVPLHTRDASASVVFSDGNNLGTISPAKEDGFVVRLFNHTSIPASVSCELPLKLTRKCAEALGTSSFEEDGIVNSINIGTDDEIATICAGKEFGLIRTTSGRLFFCGKPSALGVKTSAVKSGKWFELTITKERKVTHVALGHDGLHAIIITEDGSVFFAGTSKRGEDADFGRIRRVPKPVKPKKMIKVDNHHMVHAACNNGTTALVTRDGEVLMFGKDTTYVDQHTGEVTLLRGIFVTQIALGKAHAVCLTSKGKVITFGINNKYQCGRDFAQNNKEEPQQIVPNDEMETCVVQEEQTCFDEPEDISNKAIENQPGASNSNIEHNNHQKMCPDGLHSWYHNMCMVCMYCNECTGYSISCLSSMRPDRRPGQECGCGEGDSGCAICGCCRICARESQIGNAELALLESRTAANLAGMMRLDLLFRDKVKELVQPKRSKLQEQLQNKIDEKKIKNRKSMPGPSKAAQKAKTNKVISNIMSSPVHKTNNSLKEAEILVKEQGGSDVERDVARIACIPPDFVKLPTESPVIQIACGLHHTVLLMQNGQVYSFGSNQYGQLGCGDILAKASIQLVKLPCSATHIAAGNNHTVVLTTKGEVYTFGNYQKGQLGRAAPINNSQDASQPGQSNSSRYRDPRCPWYAIPGPIPNVGPRHGRRATWVGASGDQTFLKIDESLINPLSLAKSTVTADDKNIILLPNQLENANSFKCLVINKSDGNCNSFKGREQVDFYNKTVCMDPVYSVLWSYNPTNHELSFYNIVASELRSKRTIETIDHKILVEVKTVNTNVKEDSDAIGNHLAALLEPELTLPVFTNCHVTRLQAAVNLLCCIDTLCMAHDLEISAINEEFDDKHHITEKHYCKEDFQVLNRFGSHGGGWGYSSHSIEAIRFMADTDILLGGYGIYGGRGEYMCKIKLLDIGTQGGELEEDGEVLAETEEIPFDCGLRQKWPILFDEPVLLQANRWYVALCKISGPSSDCGSAGQGMITTEDGVVFYFKSSKKSNNGTDVNAGQIPQLLYKLLTYENITPTVHHIDVSEPIHVLSKDFSRSVTKECFQSLISLLQWSWNTFKLGITEGQPQAHTFTTLDLERLVYISRASLRLLRTYVREVCPIQPGKKLLYDPEFFSSNVEDVRTLLKQILSDNIPMLMHSKKSSKSKLPKNCTVYSKMINSILDECHTTFVSCFHAFYPSASVKWKSLCDLLNDMDNESKTTLMTNSQRLLGAVLCSLCAPTVQLSSIIPTLKQETLFESSLNQGISYGTTVYHMNELNQAETGSAIPTLSWNEVLDKLINIVTEPVSRAILGHKYATLSSLTRHCSHLLARIVAEMVHQYKGDSDTQVNYGRLLQRTESRFVKGSYSATWNTGNGSPEAICFQVDRPGISIAGIGVFGGPGHFEYEFEILEEHIAINEENQTRSQRWMCLDITRGAFGPEDINKDVVEIRFDKPIPIKSRMPYVIRLRIFGGKTKNGDGGVECIKGSDETMFFFSTSSLSFNGTTVTRGQIPYILYYCNSNDSAKGPSTVLDNNSRKAGLTMATSIIQRSCKLLALAREKADEVPVIDILNNACIIRTLLPMVLAHMTPLATDPHGSVTLLNWIQTLLPHVTALNLLEGSISQCTNITTSGNSLNQDSVDANTTSQHYTWVQSEHPYKPSSVSNYRVLFPKSVKWMSLEFDPASSTVQPEDFLQLYVPSTEHLNGMKSASKYMDVDQTEYPAPYWPVLQKFSSSNQWIQNAVIIPGNEVVFSVQTASDYLKDDRASAFGFKCLVVGYENIQSVVPSGLKQLEAELAFLGGMCASTLIKKDLQLPTFGLEYFYTDVEMAELIAAQTMAIHGSLLSKGLALSSPPTVNQALDDTLPYSVNSNERQFLRDFVGCVAGTSGGRFAQWLQPGSRVDPSKCHVMYSKDELRYGWPAIITVFTCDQYADIVQCPNMKVEVKAIPIDKKSGQYDSSRKMRRVSQPEARLVGGNLETNQPYETTIKDKMCFHSITFMKAYQNYSFEELRYIHPPVKRYSENMLVRPNGDGSYSATWTPASIGCYSIVVYIDGYVMPQEFKVEVKEPPQGMTPPSQNLSKKQGAQPNKLRKFVAKPSAGLRIRSHPSLQSEQIGVVPVNGTIAFIEEIHNDDGVWLSLSADTIKQYCLNPYNEAWCLQYNQHLGKTLLLPVEEPKSILDQVINETIAKRLPEIHSHRRKGSTSFTGTYEVLKCGASGHNIRVRPSLRAQPIGMLVLGNRIGVSEYVVNSDGCWVSLDQQTKEKYGIKTDLAAWSLAMGHNNVMYLGPVSEKELPQISSESDGSKSSNKRGFDFVHNTASKPLEPHYAFTSQPPVPPAPALRNCEAQSTNPFVFGDADRPESPKVPRREKKETKLTSLPKWVKGDDGKGDGSEFSGVSVKELVKAIGESRANGNGVTPPDTPKRSASPRTGHLSPKPMSRSSSPVAIPHMTKQTVQQSTSNLQAVQQYLRQAGRGVELLHGSNSSSPQGFGSPRSIGISPLVSGTGQESSARRGSNQSDTSALVSSITRDLSQSPSQATHPRDLSPSPSGSSINTKSEGSPPATPNKKPATDSESSSRKLTQTGTQTSPETSSNPPIKGTFSIGSTSKGERVSPKMIRKDRCVSKNRTKRSISPANLHPLPMANKINYPDGASASPVKEATSPSVAEALRAVFAAFLWHEGIAHDAMACASFLKFHPTLPKQGALVVTRHGIADPPIDKRREELSKEEKARQRHSVEVTPATGSYLNIQPATLESLTRSAANANANRNRSRKVPENTIREGITTEKFLAEGALSCQTVSVLPPALKCLVYLWEELTSNCMEFMAQNVIISSPINQKFSKEKISAKSSSNKERIIEKDTKKAKKKKIQRSYFGDDPGMNQIKSFFNISSGRDTLCELCGERFPHPVTYHMKQEHQGCGQHSGSKGYNSGGNYCLGWAGNCGDGGVAGSSWYLLCESCRERYIKGNRGSKPNVNRSKNATKRKSAYVMSLISPTTSVGVDSHIIMKDNALFLLELASSAETGMSHQRRLSSTTMPSVSEKTSPPDYTLFFPAPPPFQCLQALGADIALSDMPFYEEVLKRHSNHEGFLQGPGTSGQRPFSEMPLSGSDGDNAKGLRFHRSVSMGTNGMPWTRTGQEGRIIMMRKRNNSSGEMTGEGGSSLLCNPSPALQKLVPKIDGSSIVSNLDVKGENASEDKSLLQRPVMMFVLQQHDLESLQLVMKQAMRKAMCRVYAMQALNWLLKSVTQPICLHDLLWWFVASLTPTEGMSTEAQEDNRHRKIDELEHNVCEHPLSDILIAGEAVQPLPSTFHTLLQTISDLMVLLPMGSSLQQMAVRCWCLRFSPADHAFIHRSQVFNNISKILSRSEEIEDTTLSMHESHQSTINHSSCSMEALKDITASVEIKASSRPAMIGSLTDGSTETFWESGDEDRNRTKYLTITCPPGHHAKLVCVHADNSRDQANKLSSITFFAGPNSEDLLKLRAVEVEAKLPGGWIICPIEDYNDSVIKLELRGVDNSLRIRQVRLLGEIEGESIKAGKQYSATTIQQRNCEAETLRVFRLITSLVFGKLIMGKQDEHNINALDSGSMSGSESVDQLEENNDLREHMVGILFSRSKLTHLQKQVIIHIVQAIRKETIRVYEEWESHLCSTTCGSVSSGNSQDIKQSDAYCFEMLSMVLALSGSSVGRAYLSQQGGLLGDLLSLLHTGSARVQRQVTSLLRRMLPEVSPEAFARVIGVEKLPPKDFNIVPITSKGDNSEAFDVHQLGILDVLLSVVAKSLTVQVKVKAKLNNGTASKDSNTVTLATSISSKDYVGTRWWLKGSVNRKLSEVIVHLLKDMASGKMSEAWSNITKAAVAQNILHLTQLNEEQKNPNVCLRLPTLWLALASMCILEKDHVDRLSSAQWTNADGQPALPRPTCVNHDDGETNAIIQCNNCGNLCVDCDRFLHLHRKTRNHHRQVCKEEEEAIKVEIHEGCGRTKLFWLLAVADSKTLKALVEYRDGGTSSHGAGASGVCRFCGATSNSGLLAIGNVCADYDCQEYSKTACTKLLSCGHICGGIQGETTCLPCLYGCSSDSMLKQDAEDMCMICFTEALSCAPALQLKCGHVFHLHCCKTVLMKQWAGPRISFAFSLCPICKANIEHPVLEELLVPIKEIYNDVRRKALMRLEYEGLNTVDAIVTPGSRFYNDPAGYAMDKYAYYVCFKCKKAYYGGEARCDAEVGEKYDPTELVCGGCSDVAQAQICPKHGIDFLEYKCRYCCSVAVFFCFGNTHFCNGCHDDFQRVTNVCKKDLPPCPAGPKAIPLKVDECPLHVKHPPTGEEFALGCGICRNAHTF